MHTDSTRKKPPWVLLARTEEGKEVEAGRFHFDWQAREFAELYRITEWHTKGPGKGSSSDDPD